MLGIYALWPKDRRDRCGGPNPLSTIDFLGNALLAVGSILVVFAMQQGGSYVWSWMSPVILGSLITSGMCWILLVGWEGYLFHRRNHRIQPIFPVHLVTTRVYILTLMYDCFYVLFSVYLTDSLTVSPSLAASSTSPWSSKSPNNCNSSTGIMPSGQVCTSSRCSVHVPSAPS